MKLLLSVSAAIAAIALALPPNAQASSYSNTSGLSQLEINELAGINRGGGSYITKIGPTNWSGRFNASTVTTIGGTTSYTGTFGDSPQIPGTTIRCSGNIKVDRTLVAGKYNISVKWRLQVGQVVLPSVVIQPCFLKNPFRSQMSQETLHPVTAPLDFNG